MGLTTWAKSPRGKILKSDVSIAKNYLKENELESMGRIVSAFLDLAEERAKRHIPMTMEDWATRIDKFLEGDDRPVLDDAGRFAITWDGKRQEAPLLYYLIYTLDPADTELAAIISSDPQLKGLAIRADGYRILVPSDKRNAFAARLKSFGYLL